MTVEDWAVKIAEAVSPDEAELAPLWAEAFVKGGKDRQELFAQTNAQAGGFLPGELMPTLPILLQALASAAASLLAILASKKAGTFLEVVKNVLSVGEIFGKARGWFSSAPATNTEEPTASVAISVKLNEVMTKLDIELQPLSLDQAKSDRLKLIVVCLLLQNPPDAIHFLNKLTEKK